MNQPITTPQPNLEERLSIHNKALESVSKLANDTRFKAELLNVVQSSLSNLETMNTITNFFNANEAINDECVDSLNALYQLCNSNLAGSAL